MILKNLKYYYSRADDVRVFIANTFKNYFATSWYDFQ